MENPRQATPGRGMRVNPEGSWRSCDRKRSLHTPLTNAPWALMEMAIGQVSMETKASWFPWWQGAFGRRGDSFDDMADLG